MTDVEITIAPLAEPARARVVAVIRALRLDAVIEALLPIEPRDLLIEEVRGYGRQKEHLAFYEKVGEWQGSFLPKVRIEFTVDGPAASAAVTAVRSGAFTGRIGDGKIFVHPVRAPRPARSESAP